MEAQTKSKGGWSPFRIVLGTFVAYIVFAAIGFLIFMAQGFSIADQNLSRTEGGNGIMAWILFPILSVLISLYSYGWLGHWLSEMKGERNAILRFVGKVFGTIGFILWPFPLMAFGANKKWLFNLLVALPLAIFGVVLFVFGIIKINIVPLPAELSGDWSAAYCIAGVFALLNALLALLAKKCPNCGCLMSKIGYETLSFEEEIYTQQYSRKIGSISDGEGNTADINELYDVEREGYANTVAKTYTCKNCNTKKQKRARTLHNMSRYDHRRYS